MNAGQLPLWPESYTPPAGGIAALAQAAETLRERNGIEYALLDSRSLLNRCGSPRVPFEWTINPYRGCEFGCRYCYARYTHEFMELRAPEDFERRIFVKRHAAELLRRELGRVGGTERIAIGTATDPYQPAERRYQVTRSLLEVLAQHSGLQIGIITKSTLIVRDLELLEKVAARNRLSVRMTVTTVDQRLARALEPLAPRPDLRLHALEKLCQSGIDAGVMCAPVLPRITDSKSALDELMRATAARGARFFSAAPLFLQPAAQAAFLPFVRREFPQLWNAYVNAYRKRAYLPASYSQMLNQRVAALRIKHGLHNYSEIATPSGLRKPAQGSDVEAKVQQNQVLSL